ncbi:MAG: hypothetical protein P9M06_04810 [Candidatus Saelkia tenebricola]|nr:hypothetical protein [Candidatus Saelkia tenebricola]
MRLKRDILSIFLTIIATACLNLPAEALFKKITQESGFKIQLDINELAAVNFMLTEDGATIKMHGETNADILLSGKNYNVDGSIAEGEKPAVRLNASTSILDIDEVTLEGTPTEEGNYEYELSMNELAAFLRKNANQTIIQNTSLEDSTIGTPSNYQIVYVDDAQLILSHNFTGYGILYIEDTTYSAEDPIFKMLGNSAWYGLIIVNQYTEEDKDSKIFLQGSLVMNLDEFVLLGIDNLTIGDNLVVNNGSVGTWAEGGILTVGDNAYFANNIIGDTINLGNNTTIEENVYYDSDFTYGHSLIHNGDEITPSNTPLIDLPDFPEFAAGTQDITVANNSSYTLAPGDYNDITLGNSSTLYLSGGTYNINKITGNNLCEIIYQGVSEVRVKGKIEFGNTLIIEPHSLPLDADDCVFYIEGEDYSPTEDVFYAYNNPIIHCNIYAPNSSVQIKNNGNYKGAIIARTVTSENNVATSIELKSAFSSSTRFIEVYGSILCSGNNFYIPNLGNNAKVYYSQEALEEVNAMLDSLPLTWGNWKETE